MEALEKEFYDFKLHILQFLAGLEEWQKNTISYRKAQNENIEKILQRIDGINSRCLEHIGNYETFRNHIAEHKQYRSVWGDRGFKITMFVMGCAWAVTFFFFSNFMNKTYAEIKDNERIIRAITTDKR